MSMGMRTGDRYESFQYTSEFGAVRRALSEAAGLGDFYEYSRPRMTNLTLLGYWVNPEREAHISGEEVKVVEDPLDYLLLHQDCEGILPHWCLYDLINRMEPLIHQMPNDVFGVRGHALRMLYLFKDAYEDGETVVFSG